MAPKRRMTTRGGRAAAVEPTAPVQENVPQSMPGTVEEEVNQGQGEIPVAQEEVSIGQALSRMTELLHNLTERRNNRGEDEALERFLKFQPPTFFGEAEQDQKAEQWTEQMEDIFSTLQYSEPRMVRFAAFKLRGPARDWWLRIQGEWRRTGQEWTWAGFIDAFRAEYIPQWVTEKREDEFQNLKQGGMTVAQYAAQFNRLSKYCKRLVDTEHNRTRQFVKGLRQELRKALAPFPPATYSAAVDAATIRENENRGRMQNKTPIPQKQGFNKAPHLTYPPVGTVEEGAT